MAEYIKGETKGWLIQVNAGQRLIALVHPKYVDKFIAAPAMYEALRKVRANIGHIIMTKADAVLVDEIDKALAQADNK